MFNKRNKKKGFTLIELIIVVAIIAILAAIAVPTFGNVSKKAKVSTDISNARTIYSVIMAEVAEGNDSIFIKDTTDADNPVMTTNVDLTKLSNLDVIPQPKAMEGDFIATVKDGEVSILVDPTGEGENIEIYPNGKEPYNQ